jgi:Domain of Unknown Function (DUF1259)
MNTPKMSGRSQLAVSVLVAAMLYSGSLALGEAPGTAMDTTTIERLTGAKGAFDEKENVFKVSVPRKDLSVVIAGVKMSPPMGLTSWAAFKRDGKDDMVMGDLVLLQDQVSPVMSAALDNGLEVTALHNHFIWDSPRIMFMHIGGVGQEQNLATAVGRVFTEIKETSGKTNIPNAQIDPAHSSLDPAKLDLALGLKGQYKDGVYKFVVGRTTRMHDVEISNQMGVNTWGTFAGSEDKAVVDGDFAMRESELQPVLRALRKAGINVVAIHQHMVGDVPRIMFLHYWGVAPANDLSKGLRSALDVTHD